jgi:gas vesicle protein
MSRTSNTLLAFLTGAATGAIVGILYAPDKGTNTRDKLSYRLDKYKEKLEDLLDDLLEGKDMAISSAKSDGEKVINDAKLKAEQLLHDVDDLIGQIKGEE